MSELKMFSVFDSKAEAFLPPMFFKLAVWLSALFLKLLAMIIMTFASIPMIIAFSSLVLLTLKLLSLLAMLLP